MKPFLGVDVTNHARNETLNGEPFLVAKAPAALKKELDRIIEEELSLFLKPALPLTAQIAQWVCGLIGVVGAAMTAAFALAKEFVLLSTAYDAMPWLFWTIGVCLIAFGMLIYIEHKREKERFGKSGHTDRYDSVAAEIRRGFGVPDEAVEVEVLSFRYKNVRGEPILQKPNAPDEADYNNFVFDAFVREEALFLADTEDCYKIPLSAFAGIRRVDKPILVSDWFKDGAHDKGEYKVYDLAVDEEDRVIVPYYYILEMHGEQEPRGLWFPCYEYKTFETLIELKSR